VDGIADTGVDDEGATPTMNPVVTVTAAMIRFRDGALRVYAEDTAIVRGRTRPLAI